MDINNVIESLQQNALKDDPDYISYGWNQERMRG